MDYFIWDVSPNIFEIGSFALRWYGVLFVAAFFLGLYLFKWIYKREGKDPTLLDTLLIYVVVGTVVGARLVHCLAYEPQFYLANPIEILMVHKGGLASHGGMVGILIALFIFSKRHNESFLWLLSRMTIPGALAAVFVRIGNFFNSEILGLPSTQPWAVIFERVDMIPRHPVQLYEALSYLSLLIILIFIYRKVSPLVATKILPGIFLIYMFSARFLLEYTKTKQEAYTLCSYFTTGQMLSIPLVLIGIVWIIVALKNNTKIKRDNDKKI